MTYRGKELGLVPKMSHIEEYINTKGLYTTPQEVWDYWSKKNWRTLKDTPVKSLESAVNVVNGIAVSRDFYKGIELKGISKAQKKKERKAIKKTLICTARNAEIKIKNESQKKKNYTKYDDQLNDKRWEAFREFVFIVRGKKCEVCGSTRCLQVHHTLYKKNTKAWEYTCNDVIIVCRDCHKHIHGIV